jgi:hypothetical protein
MPDVNISFGNCKKAHVVKRSLVTYLPSPILRDEVVAQDFDNGRQEI